MITVVSRFILYFLWLLSLRCVASAQEFSLVKKDQVVTIIYSNEGPKIDSISAHFLAEDIKRVTGSKPKVTTDVSAATGNVIVIGNIASTLVQKFIGNQSAIYKKLEGKWECFALKVIDKPVDNVSRTLLIAGSDPRGTAYGVFTLSEKLGVSPWYWWADVPVKQQKQLTIQQPEYISSPPAVKYRGIFINDEDWGLQPWAAKTFETETNDIGPKTYAKVFELLLRLKANLIWPAMHPSTKAFFHYPLNKKVADDYAIIIGSSHAEPMLRNNVGEWDTKAMGHFNYITNKEKVYQYWESRVKEIASKEVIFTLGMRGVHDSGLEGVKSAKEAIPLLEQIINDQRDLLKKYQQKDISVIPQVFTAYKEVLNIYDAGLKLPDDVTIVWPDDNYGYIHRLNTQEEQKRAGGSGVYYHASYWGRPHDYLWLSSTHPSLIREEMIKAYENGSNRLWVLNVGDIKPIEYNIQLFMDMAYNARPFKESSFTKKHFNRWHLQVFGPGSAEQITNILWDYYNLAFERRPEFMGWSQTEPTTKTTYTEYNHFYYGDEAQKRVDRYEVLEKQVKALRKQMDSEYSAAFYQLVYYPVVCASLMNKKFLYRDKSYLYARQNRLSAFDYAKWSQQAYDSIVSETDHYNNRLAGGKWKNIMSMKPRNLPVYLEPYLPDIAIDKTGKWGVSPEGLAAKDSSMVNNNQQMALPPFDVWSRQKYFIDIYLSDDEVINWTARVSEHWVRLSTYSGQLSKDEGKKQFRVWVDIDWSKVPNTGSQNASIIFAGGGKQVTIRVNALKNDVKELLNYKGFIENAGYVSMFAAHFTLSINKQAKWEVIDGLGYAGKTMRVSLYNDKPNMAVSDPEAIKQNNSCLEYEFFTFSDASPVIHVFTLPGHPLNNHYSMRYAVSIDDGPLKVVDFRTYGRSEEWKQNVLRNQAVRKIEMPLLNNGKHRLRIYAVDPAVMPDRILIDLGGLKRSNSLVAETIVIDR